MRRRAINLGLIGLAALVSVGTPTLAAPETWLLSVDRWGNAEHAALTLEVSASEASGSVLSGKLDDWTVSGRRNGDAIAFVATDSDGDTRWFEGVARDGVLTGWADYEDTSNTGARVRHGFSGLRLTMPDGPPGHRTYAPETFSNTFTADLAPVMVIQPGDVIATRTVDSGGVDAQGRVVALYGNPQTGPFFVAGAKAGDVLAVHIRKLTLDRDWADSLDGFSGRAMSQGIAQRSAALTPGLGARVRWRLDREAGTARLDDPPEALKDYVVPIKPMLGGLGVAPDFGFPAQSAGDTGRFGGNMDLNEIREGATVYLPVFQPGAMLFLGDGHALQGDGETTQWALETSLTIEFSVEILPARPLAGPRVETADRITVLGQAPSLDEAVRAATGGMVQWLQQDYGLTLSEASMILGTAAEYRVATLAGQNAGLSLSLDKAGLAGLRRVVAP